MNERQAILDLQQDSHEAFAWLVERYQEALMHLAYRLTGNNDHAQELVQETLWRLWQHRHSLDPRRPLKGWLVAVLARLNVDQWRKQHREVPLDPTLFVAPARLDPRLERLEVCLRRLSPQQRTVVVMFYTEGYRLREIARILGVQEGTVKTHLFRARQALKRCLEESP